jgi:undecaprenyl-diphosphatase
MDTYLFFLINQSLQNPFFDLIMPFITQKPYVLFAIAAIPFIFFEGSQGKDWRRSFFIIGLCLTGVALGDGSANVLKHVFERLRPCQELDGVRLLVGCGGAFSMPSNHTVNAFAAAAIFSHFFRKSAVPMFLIAVLVAFSRIYVGVHYPSDVLAGAVLGGVVAGAVLILHKWATERFKEKPHTTVLIISLLALSLFRYYYILTGPVDLSPDEAHYWEWSRRLDLSYYSKGPAIAYLIALTTRIMGDTVFAVRFFAPILLALCSVIIYKLTLELFPSSLPLPCLPDRQAQGEGARGRVACAAAITFQIIPLFSAYGVLMTIDSPFIFLWTLSLYLFWKAVSQGSGIRDQGLAKDSQTDPRPPTPDPWLWSLLGITIGLGLLTKYTMAFFYVCAFLFMIFSKEHRLWFKRKEPYLAFIVSILIFSPVIIWNAQHDWVTLKHTAGQAHISSQWSAFSSQRAKDFFEFIGSQVGVLTPLLFFSVIYGAIKSRVTSHKLQATSKDKNSSLVTRHSSLFLFWFWAPVLVFFILKSLHAKVQANWAMFAYVTAIIASAGFFLDKQAIKKGMKIFLSISLITAFLVTIISHYPQALNLPVKQDPTSRLKGWREIGIKTGEVYNSMISSGSKKVFIFSDKYQVSSELAFYVPDKPVTYCVNLGSRMNQYDVWGGFDKLLGFDAIFVTTDNGNFPAELKGAFDSFEAEEFTVHRKDGEILRKYFIFKCYGFKGLSLKSIESY